MSLSGCETLVEHVHFPTEKLTSYITLEPDD